MSANLAISPDLSKEETDPDYVIRMIILGPKANVGENEIVNHLHLLDLPLTVKWTCYGAMVAGKSEDVEKAIKEVRKLDPYNIFTKSRGFPPGDPRRCRGHRYGPREGFHQIESEYKILGDVGDALKHPRDVYVERPKPIDVDEFVEIVKESIEEEDSKKE